MSEYTTEAEISKIQNLRAKGLSIRKISKILNLSTNTVSRFCPAWNVSIQSPSPIPNDFGNFFEKVDAGGDTYQGETYPEKPSYKFEFPETDWNTLKIGNFFWRDYLQHSRRNFEIKDVYGMRREGIPFTPIQKPLDPFLRDIEILEKIQQIRNQNQPKQPELKVKRKPEESPKPDLPTWKTIIRETRKIAEGENDPPPSYDFLKRKPEDEKALCDAIERWGNTNLELLRYKVEAKQTPLWQTIFADIQKQGVEFLQKWQQQQKPKIVKVTLKGVENDEKNSSC